MTPEVLAAISPFTANGWGVLPHAAPFGNGKWRMTVFPPGERTVTDFDEPTLLEAIAAALRHFGFSEGME